MAFTHNHAVQQLLWMWYSAASLYRPNAIPIIMPMQIPSVRLCKAVAKVIPHKTVMEIGKTLFFIVNPSLASYRSLVIC